MKRDDTASTEQTLGFLEDMILELQQLALRAGAIDVSTELQAAYLATQRAKLPCAGNSEASRLVREPSGRKE